MAIRGKDSDVVSVVIPKTMKAEIKVLAAKDRRTVSQWIAIHLEDIIRGRAFKS